MNLRPSRAAAVLSVAVPLALASPLTAFAAGNSTPHGTGNSSFAVDGKTEDLTGQEWTQSGGKGVGDFPVAISSSGTSTVKGGYVHGDYPSSWTWSQLKTGWHYNGAAFKVSGSGTLTFDGQHTRNVAVDAYRVNDAPSKLVIKNNLAEDIRDDFVSYPNESSTNELDIEDNLVHTFSFLSWRNTGGTDTKTGKVKVVIRGNVIHMKPQSGSGGCSAVQGDGKVAGRVFKFDSYKGDQSLVTVENNVFLIEEGTRDGCVHTWLQGRYANNTIVYTGPSNMRAKFLGNVPAGVTVTTDRSVWDRAVADWTARH